MDAAFAHGGKSIFVHLDKDNGKIWFDENDMTEEEKAALETELPELHTASNCSLIWENDLQEWLRNPYNRVSKFADALAELVGLKTVNFAQLSLAADLSVAYPLVSEVLKDDGLRELSKCFGVTFTFKVKDDPKALKVKIEDLGIQQEGIRVLESPLFNAVIVPMDEGKVLCVKENDGSVRLLWNAFIREYFKGMSTKTDEDMKEACENFWDEILKRIDDASCNTVDFKVAYALKDPELQVAVKRLMVQKVFWDILHAKFGSKNFTFVLPDFVKDETFDDGVYVLRYLKNFGWEIEAIKEHDALTGFKVTVKAAADDTGGKGPDGGVPEEPELNLGGVFKEEPYIFDFNVENNRIVLPSKFQGDFVNGWMDAESFCKELQNYVLSLGTAVDDGRFVVVDLRFCTKGSDELWAKLPFRDFIRLLYQKMKKFCFVFNNGLKNIFPEHNDEWYKVVYEEGYLLYEILK